MITRTGFRLVTACAILPLLLSGCLSGGGGGGSSSSNTPDPVDPGEPGQPDSTFVALFNTSTGDLPFPTNLPFLGTSDGTLNLTLGDNPTALATQMNDLDGWSTVSPIEIRFAGEVDASSLNGQIDVWRSTLTSIATAELLKEAAALFTNDGAAAATQLINTAVAAGEHEPLTGHVVPAPGFTCAEKVTTNFEITVAATDSSVVLLKPLTPLAAANEQDCLTESGAFYTQVIEPSDLDSLAFSNGHVLAVRDGMRSVDGEPVIADQTYAMLRDTPAADLPAAMAPLAAIYQPTFQILEDANIEPASTALAFSFSTQSISHALEHIADNVEARPAGFILATANPTFQVFAGVMQEVPYYLNNKPANIGTAAEPTPSSAAASVLTGQWTNASGQGVNRFDPAPVATQQVDVPVMVTIPTSTMPANGWPVAIYQHGLGSSRGAVLGLAPLFAAQGWAMIAIDHPLHGILPSDTYGLLMNPFNERHFYMDMDDDGTMDASGAHATPLSSRATTRDVRRQTVSDLLYLLASMPGMNMGTNKFDTDQIGYVGISMGGVIGTMLAGVSGDQIKAFSLNVPGGGMGKSFDGSPIFAAQARPTLAANGREWGTKDYEDFLNRAQTVEDSGDPINYVRHVADGNASIYVSEMVGDLNSNPVAPPDLVMPNNLLNTELYNHIYQTIELSDTQVAETAPLSGTTPLWQNMELQTLTEGEATERPIRRVARFAVGSHYSLHLPTRPNLGIVSTEFPDQRGPEAMDAVQRHAVQLLTSLGTELDVTAAEEDLLVE